MARTAWVSLAPWHDIDFRYGPYGTLEKDSLAGEVSFVLFFYEVIRCRDHLSLGIKEKQNFCKWTKNPSMSKFRG